MGLAGPGAGGAGDGSLRPGQPCIWGGNLHLNSCLGSLWTRESSERESLCKLSRLQSKGSISRSCLTEVDVSYLCIRVALPPSPPSAPPLAPALPGRGGFPFFCFCLCVYFPSVIKKKGGDKKAQHPPTHTQKVAGAAGAADSGLRPTGGGEAARPLGRVWVRPSWRQVRAVRPKSSIEERHCVQRRAGRGRGEGRGRRRLPSAACLAILQRGLRIDTRSP